VAISSFSAESLGRTGLFRYLVGVAAGGAIVHVWEPLSVNLPALALLLTVAWSWPTPAFAQLDGEPLARRLLNSQGCKACHRLDDAGASFAPDLSKVGSRLNRQQLRDRLVNPAHRHAGERIADFSHLQENEIDALILFLSQRR
jgi:cytochrome c2